MKEAEVEEIDLLHKENVFGAAWLIRYFYGDTTMEEVQVTKIKLDGGGSSLQREKHRRRNG